MIQVKVRLQSLKADILSNAKPDEQAQLIEIASKALEELVAATPVDTGKAAGSWSFYPNSDGSITLENDVAYIKLLNAGSSAQAPAYFIESIVLKYGKPLGSIVTYK